MDKLRSFVGRIDSVSEWSGRIFCWISLPLVLFMSYDVIMRYLFQAPTKWAYEMTWMQYGALFMLGGAYGLKHKLHVRVDILFAYIPERAARRLTMITSLLGGLACLALCVIGCQSTWEAYVRELPEIKTLAVPRWILMWVIPYGSLLLSVEFFIKARGHWLHTAPAPTRSTD